jgi:hypothetical protein
MLNHPIVQGPSPKAADWAIVIPYNNFNRKLLSGQTKSDLLWVDGFQQADQWLLADLDQAFLGAVRVEDQQGDGREYW